MEQLLALWHRFELQYQKPKWHCTFQCTRPCTLSSPIKEKNPSVTELGNQNFPFWTMDGITNKLCNSVYNKNNNIKVSRVRNIIYEVLLPLDIIYLFPYKNTLVFLLKPFLSVCECYILQFSVRKWIENKSFKAKWMIQGKVMVTVCPGQDVAIANGTDCKYFIF